MTGRRVLSVVGTVLVAASLTACGSSEPTTPAAASSSAAAPASSGSTTAESSASGATVKVAKTSVGDVVVDAKGMTLYMYTKDTKGSGTSTCAGDCLAAWPPLLADGTPTADGVTGALATIATADGKKQVTLDGWPLYYYVKDKAAGDVTGQGVGTIWWVLDKDAKPIMAAADTGGNAGY